MIDFRYHVVSLVSVFLALAIGIVLGAGSLRNQIGVTLQQQVQKVVEEKKQLHDQLSVSDTEVKQRDVYLAAVSAQLTSAALAGHSVVIVAVPGVPSADLDASVRAVDAAGGVVTTRILIDENWTAAGETSRRSQALTQLAAVDLLVLPTAQNVQAELAGALGRALASNGATGGVAAGAALTSAQLKVVDILKSQQLITVDGTLKVGAFGAIMLAPEVATASTATPNPSASAGLAGQVGAWAQVAGALDAHNGGAVVLGPTSSAADGGLVAAIRADKAMSLRVSTVDEGATPMGEITAVLALRQQFLGQSGAYGYGSGASGPMPGVAS
jgi:hypothetical protein